VGFCRVEFCRYPGYVKSLVWSPDISGISVYISDEWTIKYAIRSDFDYLNRAEVPKHSDFKTSTNVTKIDIESYKMDSHEIS